MGTFKMIDRLENLWEKDPYKKVERSLRDFYKGLNEEEKKETAKELEEISKYIPSKEIPGSGLKDRVVDAITRGKRKWIWPVTAFAGFGTLLAGTFTGNYDLNNAGLGAIVASLPGFYGGAERGKYFDSIQANKLLSLSGSELKELRNEYSF